MTRGRHQTETFSALLALCVGNSPPPGEFPPKGQWHGALMFSLNCVWINSWINNREAGDLRRHRAHYDVIVMKSHANCHPFCGGWHNFATTATVFNLWNQTQSQSRTMCCFPVVSHWQLTFIIYSAWWNGFSLNNRSILTFMKWLVI